MDLFLRHEVNMPDVCSDESPSCRSHGMKGKSDTADALAGGEYGAERAYDVHRARRRAWLGIARTVLFVAAVPVVAALVFVVSYAVTCILDGASPEELVDALATLFEQAHMLFVSALARSQ